MVAATTTAPKTYTTDDRGRAQGARPTAIGLRTGDIAALNDFFRWHAARCGFRSGQGAFEASCWGMSGGGLPDQANEQMATVVTSRDYASARGVERALREMDRRGEGLHVTVLYLLYGEAPIGAREYAASFGDVWQIAHLTDAAELAREHYALHEGTDRESTIAAAFDESNDQRRQGLEVLFWECAKRIARLDDMLTNPRTKPATRLEVERRRDGWHRTMATTLHAYEGDGGRLRARLTALESADRELSTTSALRRRLRYAGPVDDKGRPNKDAHAAWISGKLAFTTEVRIEADRLRVRASTSYVQAREATAP